MKEIPEKENNNSIKTPARMLGDRGEDITCEYLKKQGYTLCFRNFSCKTGEIDIIAADYKACILSFVEVKTRSRTDFGLPCQAVGWEKQRKIRLTANFFLLRFPEYSSLQPRMDIAEVIINSSGTYFRYMENAF